MGESTILRKNNCFKFTSVVLMITLLTGCSTNIPDNLSDLMSNASEFVSEAEGVVSNYVEGDGLFAPQEYTLETFDKVLELIQKKDTQAIYDMFSDYIRENVDIMPDIEKLVEFMEGEIAEIGYTSASNDYQSVRDGEVTRAGYSATAYIKTTDGITYWFRVGTVTTDEDETKLGLDWIYILNCNVQNTYVAEHGEWHRNNGAKEDEPQIPENIAATVNY